MNDNTEEQRATTVIEIKLRACRRGLGCWRWEVGGDGRVRGQGLQARNSLCKVLEEVSGRAGIGGQEGRPIPTWGLELAEGALNFILSRKPGGCKLGRQVSVPVLKMISDCPGTSQVVQW